MWRPLALVVSGAWLRNFFLLLQGTELTARYICLPIWLQSCFHFSHMTIISDLWKLCNLPALVSSPVDCVGSPLRLPSARDAGVWLEAAALVTPGPSTRLPVTQPTPRTELYNQHYNQHYDNQQHDILSNIITWSVTCLSIVPHANTGPSFYSNFIPLWLWSLVDFLCNWPQKVH